jgi:hypothetical protein
MLTTKRKPATVGEILTEEFMEPMGLTQATLAEAMGVQRKHVNELCNDRRNVTKISGLSGRQLEMSCCLEAAVQRCGANCRDAVSSPGRPSHTLLLGHAHVGDFIHTAFRTRC